MPLKLVPQSEPSPKEKVLRRVRATANPQGFLQCKRCGGRAVITVLGGATLVNGRVRGTVIAKHECAECWKQGIYSPMLPELKPVK